MNTKTILIFVAVTVGVLAGITALLWNFGNQTEQPVPEVAGEMRHVQGEGEVVVVEWSDFQCPACRGAQSAIKQIMAKYEGQAKLVFRHLPLTTIHSNAMVAAQAAEAASRQGKFWEMHDLLFERQGEWEEMGDPREKFGEYASELELDGEKFSQDMDSDEVEQLVRVDAGEAIRYKVQATPTFFVNGVRTELRNLELAIEENTTKSE